MTTLLVSALAMGFAAQPVSAQVTVQVTIGRFYRELAPYGRWINCRYGRCWVPARVARRWQPYTRGRWVYTDYGWTWVSNDPWGSTPYHYGTWTSIRGYGWVWVPGTVWAPSWVTWSYSDRYVGWAPLPPSVVFGESGYAGRPVVVSQTQYVFVPMNRFVDTDIDSVRVSAQESASIFRQTTPVTSFAVSGGIVRNMAIPMETVQRARGGGRIEPRNIGEARTAPGSMAEGRGTSRQVSVVAPARDVNAAVAAAPKAESRPAQRQQAAPTESRQQRQQVAPAAPRQQRQQVAPAESRQQRQQIAPAAPRKEQQQAAPAEPRQQQPRAGAEKPARPAAQAGQPKPQPGHEEPVKKEKDKKDEKQ
jgi:hypothetical protein